MYEFFFSSRRWMVRLQRDRSHVGHLLVIGSILLLRRHDLLVTDQILVLFTSTKYTIFTTQMRLVDTMRLAEACWIRTRTSRFKFALRHAPS